MTHLFLYAAKSANVGLQFPEIALEEAHNLLVI